MPSQTEMTKQAFEEKLRVKPNSLVFSRLADSYRKSGDVQQAITICLEGLKVHPDYITGRIILGRCFLEQENFNDAINEFSKICKLDRRNQIAIKMLADIFSKQGMEEKAGDLYNLLLKMDPDNPSIVHLANIFKGSNRENLFEILGIEEDVKVEKVEEDQTEAQENFDDIGGVDIDQEIKITDVSTEEAAVAESLEDDLETPELSVENETAVSEIVGEDSKASELSADDEVTIAEPAEEKLNSSELTTEEEAAVSELVGEDSEAKEITADEDAADVELMEEELKEIGITTEEEVAAGEAELKDQNIPLSEDTILSDLTETATEMVSEKEDSPPIPEDIKVLEVEKETSAILEAKTEDLETPTIEPVTDTQAEAETEEESSLDEIPILEGDKPSYTSPTDDIAIKGKPEAEEIEEITEIKEEEIKIDEKKEEVEKDKSELDEDSVLEEITAAPDTDEDEKPGAISDELKVPTAIADKELPGGDDISTRMTSMFGEDVEELGVDITENPVSDEDISVGKTDTMVSASGSEDITPSSEGSELSSRIENMFGEEGEAVEELTVPLDEKKIKTTEDILPEVDLSSAPTLAIDKDVLNKIRESDVDLTEEFKGEISETEDGESELLGISDDATTFFEDISEEKGVVHTPTKVIDVEEEAKTELVEEAPETKEESELYDEEIYNELVIDQEDEEVIFNNIAAKGTSVLNKDTPGKTAAPDVEEPDEPRDTQSRNEGEGTHSVSGEDVFSRLDEMFPTETKERPSEKITGITKEIAKEPILEEITVSSELKEEIPSKQTDSIGIEAIDSEEHPSGKDIESRIDEIFIEDELQEEALIDSIADYEIDESVLSEDYDTVAGEASPLKDREVIMEESYEMPEGSDTVALNISPADEMDVVEDETGLSETLFKSIPDEEIENDKLTGEFYTETGEAAPLEDSELTKDETLDIPDINDTDSAEFVSEEKIMIADDEIPDSDTLPDSIADEDSKQYTATGEFDSTSAETTLPNDREAMLEEIDNLPDSGDAVPIDPDSEKQISLIDKEFADADITIESIPDEEFEEADSTVEFYTESGEIAPDENGTAIEKETEIFVPEETALERPPTGDDVIESIDKMFHGDQLEGDSSADAIPDEEIGDGTTAGDGFYTVSGEDASRGEADEEMLSSLEKEDKVESFLEDEETFFFESNSPKEKLPNKHSIPKEEALHQKAESIPDHVLTPTLADIYFQQDQPYLAVQIYKRLLERDPDNEKIIERINEIEQVIKEREVLIGKVPAEKKETARNSKKKKRLSTRKKQEKNDKRPLKGTKIKKDVKERIKKARKELDKQ